MLAAVFSICLGACVPQGTELPRSKAFGVVLDQKGEPWVGATVRLFSRAHGPGARVGTLDSVDAVTDERGRFRCAVLRGRAYTVWATGDDGRQARVVERVFAGDPVELRESKQRSAPIRFSVKGLDAWAKRGPLQWSLLTLTKNVIEVRGELGEDGVVSTPPVPGIFLSLMLTDRDGRFIAHYRGLDSATDSVELHPPRKVRARIHSIDSGKPVAGGRIWWSDSGSLQRGRIPVVDLDAQGCAEFELSADSSGVRVGAYFFRVTAEGCNSGMPLSSDDIRLGDSDEEAEQARKDGVTLLRCGLEPGQDSIGRLLWKDGSPVAGASIVVRNQSRSRVTEKVRFETGDLFAVVTDADGRFAVSGVQGDLAVTLEIVFTDEIVAKLPVAWRGRIRSLGLLGVVPKLDLNNGKAPVHDFGDLVLDRDFWPLDLELQAPDGRPAVGASLALRLPGADSYSAPIEKVGRLGRFCLLVPREFELQVGVIHQQSSRIEAMRFAAKASIGEPQRVRYQLKESRKLVVHVVDSDGKPVSGANLSISRANDGRESMLERAEAPASSDSVVVRSAKFERSDARKMLSAVLSRLSGKTDANGVATMFVPDIDASICVSARGRVGGVLRNQDLVVVLDDEEGVIELRMQLDG